MISLVTMATNVDSKLLTIVFLFLSGTDHSVKVLSNSELVRAGALLEFFGGYRELMLRKQSVTDGRTHGRTHARTDGQRENSIPTTNKVCGGV